MKRQLLVFLLVFTVCNPSYANWFQDIIDAINKQARITNGLLDQSLSIQRNQLSATQDIDGLMKQLYQYFTGHSGWGTFKFQDYQSYGEGAQVWSAVLQMAEQGQGTGYLGQTIGGIANQFPAERNAYNSGVSNPTSQKYYALKTQTVLATRAASQLDYNKIQQQISYQQMLQQQIEQTKDLKAAMDLASRIQVEGNLINLQILRQVALANQQQAVTEQANINVALSNARFLTFLNKEKR